jgi:hypothetical protein
MYGTSKPVSAQAAPSAPGKNPARAIIGLCFLLGAGLAWFFGPLLVRDFTLGENLTKATRFHIVSSDCKMRLFTFCHIKVGEFPGGPGHELELQYAYFDLKSEYSVNLLQKASDPSVVTTDLGQKMLSNRAATLAALLALIFWYIPNKLLCRLRKE